MNYSYHFSNGEDVTIDIDEEWVRTLEYYDQAEKNTTHLSPLFKQKPPKSYRQQSKKWATKIVHL